MQNNIQIPLFQVKFIPHKLKNTPIINKTEWLNSVLFPDQFGRTKTSRESLIWDLYDKVWKLQHW